MKVNADRLLRDMTDLGRIGYTEGRGVSRMALNDADLKARRWFTERLRAAGLQVRQDAAANIIGRLPAADGAPRADQTVVVASHLDTVPSGGRYDGALGVMSGLECARVLAENGVRLPWNLEVIDFTDEEGYHFAGTFGSRAMMGHVDPAEVDRRKAAGVPTMVEDIRKIGLDAGSIADAARDPASFRAYFELHVEQGARMERQGLDVAAVTGIVGIYRYVVEVEGQANHAGTTPMYARDDALVAASPVFRLLPEWARARSLDMVATVGQVAVEPAVVNVIPGLCRFSVELRSLNSAEMKSVRNRLHDWLDDHVRYTMQTVLEKDGVALNPMMIDVVQEAAREEGYRVTTMASGAGHDAQSFAPSVPTGMIFVPSKDGLSHCPGEYSEPDWVVAGAQTLLRSLLKMAELDSTAG